MKLKLHSNGWTGILDNFDFATATQEDINEIGKFLASNTLLVAKNQGHLSIDDQIRVCEMFGNTEQVIFPDEIPNNMKHLPSIFIPGGDNKVQRVTGELDEHGNPGLFGHVSDLDWHCNQPAMPTRKPLVWLLGVKGTAGSRTSWTNNIAAYNSLDINLKEKIKDLKMVCGFKRGNYSEFDFGNDNSFNEYYTPNLVHTNIGNKTGLFFPYLQFKNFVGKSEEESLAIIEELKPYVLNDNFIYHHDWEDGDVVIAEQWLGIHKRWKFEGMANRVLHRITMDFNNIKFN